MNRIQRLRMSLFVALPLIVVSACNRPAPPAAPTRPSPEDSFQFIVATIRRSIETSSSGLSGGVAHGDGGYTALSINNKVLDTYIAPAAEGQSPRGKITIDSESEVTIQPGSRSGDRRDDSRGIGDSGIGAADNRADASVFTKSDRTSAQRGDRPSLIEAPLPSTNKVSTTYELAYRNGRWELESEIDQSMEPATYEVFQHALRMQF
jgi:hypothetical protein